MGGQKTTENTLCYDAVVKFVGLGNADNGIDEVHSTTVRRILEQCRHRAPRNALDIEIVEEFMHNNVGWFEKDETLEGDMK